MSSTSSALAPTTPEHKPLRMNTVVLFAFTSFLSALLLFQVQLIVNKYILPWFGGAAAVWTTSMLVFQILLLAGYVYSHLVSERLSCRAQSSVHLGLLAAVFLLVLTLSLVWPSAITPGASWKPQSNANPVRSVTAVLLLSAGLPFFVLSTTGPLLQRWFARVGGGVQPYRLYAVSNVGSLLGLLTFPFLMEPTFHIATQGRLWALLFGAFVVGCALCAWAARHAHEETAPPENMAPSATSGTPALVRTLWFLLAACASALLLATTNLLCQDITSIPLLWVLPLALYLLSFILCFDHPRWYRREIFHPLLVVGIVGFCFAPRNAQVVIMPVLLFCVCVICHGELARLKPEVRRLTSFYLSISAGGALGGVFVALVAPLVFHSFTEFQISLAASLVLLLCCLFLDRDSWIYRMGFWLPAVVAAGTIAATYAAGKRLPELAQLLDAYKFYPLALLISTLVLAGAYLQKAREDDRGRKMFRPGQVLIIVLAVSLMALLYRSTQPESDLYLSKRNFFGVLRVDEQPGGRVLFHGKTVHGSQLKPPNHLIPVSYYGPGSGIGILLRNHPKRHDGKGALRVGIVGMGAGTLAAYGMPGDSLRYYEIDPDVIALSAGPEPVFTYIHDSKAKVDIELGDARMVLEREAAGGEQGNFDVLVLDAFSDDGIPVHLLTLEAFATYWKLVNPEHGIIAVHVSSRHINLMPVIEGTAKRYNASLLVRAEFTVTPFLDNLWVLMAQHTEALQVDGLSQISPPGSQNTPPRVWTDDYSDIIRLLY